jgi:hypothetical protein
MKSKASCSSALGGNTFCSGTPNQLVPDVETRLHSVFSFQLGTTYALHDRCALVEAPVVFSLFERLALEISLVIYGCKVTGRIRLTGPAAVIYFIFAHGFRRNELFIRRSRDEDPTSTSNWPGSVTQSFFGAL